MKRQPFRLAVLATACIVFASTSVSAQRSGAFSADVFVKWSVTLPEEIQRSDDYPPHLVLSSTIDTREVQLKLYFDGNRQWRIDTPSRFSLSKIVDWRLYDPANPCTDLKGVTCRKLGVQTVAGHKCTAWELTPTVAPLASVSEARTIWIDQKTGITVKTEKGAKPERLSIELRSIKEGPQPARAFEAPTRSRRLVLQSANPRTPFAPDSVIAVANTPRPVLPKASPADGRIRPSCVVATVERARLLQNGDLVIDVAADNHCGKDICGIAVEFKGRGAGSGKEFWGNEAAGPGDQRILIAAGTTYQASPLVRGNITSSWSASVTGVAFADGSRTGERFNKAVRPKRK